MKKISSKSTLPSLAVSRSTSLLSGINPIISFLTTKSSTLEQLLDDQEVHKLIYNQTNDFFQ